MRSLEQLREELHDSFLDVLFCHTVSPESYVRVIAPGPLGLTGPLDSNGFPLKTQTDTSGSYVMMLHIGTRGFLRPFRELPEYQSFIARHPGRLPTEDLLTHVFRYGVTVRPERSPLIEVATFYQGDYFTVNGEPYEPIINEPVTPQIHSGGIIQYHDITDVGKRAYRAENITGIDILFPTEREREALFVAEMPADIAITTRS